MEFDLTDKGSDYLDKLRDLGESIFMDPDKMYNYSSLILIDKGTPETVSYMVNKFPSTKISIRRLFEAGYIEEV